MFHKELGLENLLGEVWVPVVGRPSEYEVSNMGRVKSLSRISKGPVKRFIQEKICAQRMRNGYLACKLENVHRIVAKAFLPTTSDLLYVNHKNGVKTDNRLENLEWCTASQNMGHAWGTGLCGESTRKKMSEKAKLRTGNKNSCWRGLVEIYDLLGDRVFLADDLNGAAFWVSQNTKHTKASKGNISRVCNGEFHSMYGYKFKYLRNENA